MAISSRRRGHGGGAMATLRVTDDQIIRVLQEAERSGKSGEMARSHGTSGDVLIAG